jgi:hypothetical protein
MLRTDKLDLAISHLAELSCGCTEIDAVDLFKRVAFQTAFLRSKAEGYQDVTTNSNLSIFRELLPTQSISQPKPNIVYGYSGEVRHETFTKPQLQAQRKACPKAANPNVTGNGIRYPFLAIEIVADCSIWAATNRCAGSAVVRLSPVNRLNFWPPEPCIDNVAYSIIDSNIMSKYLRAGRRMTGHTAYNA